MLEQRIDQAFTRSFKKIKPLDASLHFIGPTRFSLITVNFSTTYFLKLMLLTLCEQHNLSILQDIVIVDNNSKDGGVKFLEQLALENKNIHLVKNKFNCTHASGIRKGFKYIERLEKNKSQKICSNAFLVCDTDIIFRNPDTLNDLGLVLANDSTAFAGELRHHLYPYPEAQASFFAVRRDCYARPDIEPIVDHGAPAYFMQRSFWKAKMELAHFPSNHGDYILHRGRSGVSAARNFHPFNAYATDRNYHPHFMGVENGEIIWANVEKRHKSLLQKQHEQVLLKHLKKHFNGLGQP